MSDLGKQNAQDGQSRNEPWEDSEAIAGLSALREVTPPSSLVPAVMQRIAEPPSFWQWLRRSRPIELRLSPLGAMGGLLMAAGALFAVDAASSRPGAVPQAVSTAAKAPSSSPALVAPTTAAVPAVPAAPAAAASSTVNEVVLVRFVLMVKGARKVAVAGDFNGWDPAVTPLDSTDGRGTFAATVPLGRGVHEYMFVVDGEWMSDPAAPERRPDGFGRDNALLRL